MYSIENKSNLINYFRAFGRSVYEYSEEGMTNRSEETTIFREFIAIRNHAVDFHQEAVVVVGGCVICYSSVYNHIPNQLCFLIKRLILCSRKSYPDFLNSSIKLQNNNVINTEPIIMGTK